MKSPSNIVLHQALHGYHDGHRELASSKQKLASADQQKLLVMSDASGSSSETFSDGYLTGYPLEASGVYALARTWPAPEMPRPGCVWTHTLLIDFADLAAMPDLAVLADLFRRPHRGDTKDYSQPLKRPKEPHGDFSFPVEEAFAKEVLLAVSSPAKTCALAGVPLSERQQATLLRIWSQQWPRLRRSFSFCTHAANDSASFLSSLDLQFVTKPNPRRNEPPSKVAAGAWLPFAIEDLRRPASFRAFLRDVAVDLRANGRERDLFHDLASIYALFREGTAPTFTQAVTRAKHLLSDPDHGEQLRVEFVRRSIETLGANDNESMQFLRANLRSLTPAVVKQAAASNVAALWLAIPDELSKWLTDDKAKREVAKDIVLAVDARQLIDALPTTGASVNALIEVRPELLNTPELWSRASNGIKRHLLDMIPSDWDRWGETLHAMMEGGATNLAKEAAQAASPNAFLEAVMERFRSRSVSRYARGDWDWLQAAVADPSAVAQYLANAKNLTQSQLFTLSQVLEPDDVPNSFGHDAWLEALLNATPASSDFEQHYLHAFLLARALGTRSRSQAELIGLTFDTVYRAAATETISGEAWSLLDPRLPDASLWFAWDRCKRIREAVAEVFVSRHLLPELFFKVTRDLQVLDELASVVREQRGGKEYLRQAVSRSSKDPNFNQICRSVLTRHI